MKLLPASILNSEKVLLTFISFVAVVITFSLTFMAALESNAIVLWSKLFSCFIDGLLLFFSFYIAHLNQNNSKLLFDFGLAKTESFAGILLSILVIIYALMILIAVFHRILYPEPLIKSTFAFTLYLLFAIKDYTLWRRLNRYAASHLSRIIVSQKRYYLISLFVNGVVLIPLSLAFIMSPDSLGPMIIDIMGALLLCFLTVYLSYSTGKRAAFDLLDKALDESIQLQILKYLAKHFDLYEQFHGQLTRQAGKIKYIELFFEFNPNASFKEVMNNIELIRSDIEAAIPNSHVFIIPSNKRLKIPL